MRKLNVAELNKELTGKRMSFMELDNCMTENGYRTVFNDGIGENVQYDENVIYSDGNTFEDEVQIFIEVLRTSNGEDLNDFEFKVLGVEEF